MKELMYIRSFSKRRLPVIVGTLLLVIIGSVWLNTAPFRSGFDIADELGGNIFPSSILSVATTDAQVIVPVDSMYVGNPKSCIAVRVRSRNAYSRVRVEVAETPFFSRSVSCVIGIFWFLRSAQKHDEALPALDAVIVPFAGAVISDTMVKHPSLFDNIKSILRGNDQIIFICIGILFLQFLADGANMGVLLVHVLCLKLQASSLTLDNQFIMPLTQFTRTYG